MQEQERLGHSVSLPRLNESFVAVKERGSLIVKLHDAKTRRVTRQLKLSLADNFFEVEDSSDEEEPSEEADEGRPAVGASVSAFKLALQMRMSGL